LPNCVVSANTTKTLKTRFDKLGTIRIQDIYNFRTYLQGTESRREFSYEES